MKFAAKKDDAVSPVIGTILLVAITVVLVAIIAAVVMPMVGGMNATHVTGIQVDKGANTLTLTSGEVPATLTITGDGFIALAGPAKSAAGTSIGSSTDKLAIGGVYYINGAAKGSENAVTIVAKYADGTEQVVWSGKLTKLE